MEPCTIHAVLFDFGGVLSDEGFRKGLMHIARLNTLDADDFFVTAGSLIISSGYLTGQCTEAHYWEQLRAHTGIHESDEDLRQVILERFTLRDWMIDCVERLKAACIRVAILSDQTNWQAGVAYWMAGHQRSLKFSAGRQRTDGTPDRTHVLLQLQIFYY